MLRDLSKTIAEYVDLPIPESKPIVGDSAVTSTRPALTFAANYATRSL